MKNSSVTILLALTTALVTLGTAGCGKYEKNPVQDLETLRKNGKTEIQKGPEKPQVITETVVVEKQVEVIKEQATVDASYLTITAEPKMIFKEGTQGQYKIKVRSLVPGVGATLTLQNELPVGASLQPAANEPGTYVLSWKPDYNAVRSEDGIDPLELTVVARFSGLTEKNKSLSALNRSQTFVFFAISSDEKTTEGAK